MADTVIDLNPESDGKKGTLRQKSCIIGGLFIENNEGRRWFKDTFGHELASNHSEDVSILMALMKDLEPHGIDARGVSFVAPWPDFHTKDVSLECSTFDFLVITYVERGPFLYDGPNGCEFVLDEQRKPLPGVKEAHVKEQLKKEFGIETTGYKSLYSNLYYEWLNRG
ncbi:hypothetical protein AGABI1DRAFT_114623 [Agaricus bisporus var. burnettii JB137-S8]|uniref:Uncharacterized protein n=2 Tax=Agaricus bisporus var. burnettii TaxID=192524 RepID=K5WSC0_AGABU|nr:uncharacterized protein AGABI1DRAFT_114623 [Agaricus bisporus var. burnettii JB137-S8]EKM78311.1 hypothetical protein AGABI1DRAFT_114623 [Agaricus bisporus var. burnettii JB137-S8]KAF7762106.1 hypothetical protein Agabi119p4_8699 [Agaricus bisporus var. burnettii]